MKKDGKDDLQHPVHNYPDKLEGKLLIVDIDYSTTLKTQKLLEVWKENFKALFLSLSAASYLSLFGRYPKEKSKTATRFLQ